MELNESIAYDVVPELGQPKGVLCFRHTVVSAGLMLMPEATMDKDGLLPAGEGKVGLSWQSSGSGTPMKA